MPPPIHLLPPKDLFLAPTGGDIADITKDFILEPRFEKDVCAALKTFWHRSGRGQEASIIDAGSSEELYNFIMRKMPQEADLKRISDEVREILHEGPAVCAGCGILSTAYKHINIQDLPKSVYQITNPVPTQTCTKHGSHWWHLYSRGAYGATKHWRRDPLPNFPSRMELTTVLFQKR